MVTYIPERMDHRYTSEGDIFHPRHTCFVCGAKREDWPGDPPRGWLLGSRPTPVCLGKKEEMP